MRRLLSIYYNENAMSFGLLLLRLMIGVGMAFYGYHKLAHFSEQAHSDFWEKEINFLGKGGTVSLGLTVFAEFFCSLFLILGLFTRISLIPLLICTGYIVAVVDKYELASAGEHGFELNHALIYFIVYLFLLLSGPGRFSIDNMISK